MNGKTIVAMLLLIPVLLDWNGAHAGEISGSVEVEARVFFEKPTHAGQEEHNGSLALMPEFYHELSGDLSLTAVPFARLDSTDEERTHFDLREFNLLWVGERMEVRAGVGKVFWGVTEFVHLVDIVNQTDLIEEIDGEEKLGQPMIHLSMPEDWGVVDLFLLPYFRERTFPGRDGRLRTEPPVDTSSARFESDAEERHLDFAVRYSHSIGDWELGIYHFRGTGREPTLEVALGAGGQPVLVPFYEQIGQTGLDAQLIAGEWLLKLEAIYRTGQGDEDFGATVAGFEYTWVRALGTDADLGFIGEWAWDERGDYSTTAFENDIMVGVRIALNDAQSTELLAGLIQDMDTPTRVLTLEGSRRIGDATKVSLDARIFSEVDEGDPLHSVENDSHIRLRMEYFF
jgi:hypothetical protein